MDGRGELGTFDSISISAAIREAAGHALPDLSGYHLWYEHVSAGTCLPSNMRIDPEGLAQRLIALHGLATRLRLESVPVAATDVSASDKRVTDAWSNVEPRVEKIFPFTIYFTVNGAPNMSTLTAALPSTPLQGASPSHIHLTDAPLVRVIVQIRFTDVLDVERVEVLSKFQNAISHSYGVLTREVGLGQPSGADGMPHGFNFGHTLTHWRFSDRVGDWHWRVTLTASFVVLESSRYSTQKDFIDRLTVVLEAVKDCVNPAFVVRQGVRYVNRINEADIGSLRSLLTPGVLGLGGTELSEDMFLSMTESVFNLTSSAKIAFRYGLLPPDSTFDPFLYPPVKEKTYVLDYDAFEESTSPFEVEDLLKKMLFLTERNYTLFRWSVTDAFLQRYGATNES